MSRPRSVLVKTLAGKVVGLFPKGYTAMQGSTNMRWPLFESNIGPIANRFAVEDV